MEENRKQNHCGKRVRREKQVNVVEKGNDSDGIPVENLPGCFYANMREIRKDVQCPICLGIIKKTRTVMECLHSFCKECIEKAMRLGNNKCPACRTHCASRRSLRANPILDELIGWFFPDIDIYENEEAAIEEEEARSKQTQESTARIQDSQSVAYRKPTPMARDASNTITGGFTWGRGGALGKPGDSGDPSTSRARTTNLNFSNLSDYFDVQVSLSPLESTPSLQQCRLSCRSSFTVDYLRQHVASQTSLKYEDVEILLAKKMFDLNDVPPDVDDTSAAAHDDVGSLSVGRSSHWLHSLDENQTLCEIIDYTDANSRDLNLAYGQKGNRTSKR